MRRLSSLVAALVCVLAMTESGAEPAGDPGLVATYHDGKKDVVLVVPTPNFALKENESIDPSLAPAFTAEWVGLLKIDKRAKYTLYDEGKSGASISVDGNKMADQSVELDLGDHPLQITFTRKPGAARLELVWKSDFFALEAIPPVVLSHRQTPPAVAQNERIEAGHLLVEELNCVACHHTTSKSVTGRAAPELSTAGNRLRPAWIAKWLENPRQFRHSASMPQLQLKPDERLDIAAFLATLKDPNNKVKEPQPSTTHVEAGKALFETVGCAACHGADKIALEGLGSKWFPGHLAEFLLNPLNVDHSGRMPSMLLGKEEAAAIAEYLVQSKSLAFEAKLTGGDANRGQQLVSSQGCLNCHVTESPRGKSLPNTAAITVAALEALGGHDAGCLAPNPTGKAMNYGLTPPQRELIAAFLASIKDAPLISVAPVYDFYHKVRTFGCINCHELNTWKPPEETERIPQLTNIGGRLRKEWINEVLTQKQRVRPWLRRRMPEFGPGNVGGIAALAVAAAGAGDPEALPSPTREEIAAGQKLLGNGAGGLGCITCHGFAGAKPNVIDDTRGPDITTVAARLRPDHFRRWVLDPKRVSPSTPMPNFFEGAPLDESAAKIETMFRYVAMGQNMPPPIGWIDTNNYVIAVHDDPVVIRTFLPNPSGGKNFPRGIAVGLPELINYCFDADTCELRYAWTGGFLDMQPSWSGRGGNVVKVLGRRFYTTSGFPLSIGDASADAKREFIGYAFADKRPQFIYRVGEVEVHEIITAPEKGMGIVRTFELDSGGKPVTFTAKEEAGVTYSSTAGELKAGKLTVPGGKVKFSVTAMVKESK